MHNPNISVRAIFLEPRYARLLHSICGSFCAKWKSDSELSDSSWACKPETFTILNRIFLTSAVPPTSWFVKYVGDWENTYCSYLSCITIIQSFKVPDRSQRVEKVTYEE